MTKQRKVGWIVMKDYYKNDINFTDSFPIIYGTKEEAEAQKAQLETGYDKSFFDPAGNDYAGYEAFMYVEQISL